MNTLYELHPTIHYIRYSISHLDIIDFKRLSNELTHIFGKYYKKKVKNKNGQEIFINKYEKHKVILTHPREDNEMTAMLSFPEEAINDMLIEILNRYLKVISPYMHQNQNLNCIEIKYDFMFNGKGYIFHKEISEFFMRYLFPKFPSRCFYEKIPGMIVSKGDYFNGDETHSCYSCGNEKNKDKKHDKPKRSKKGTTFKMYFKQEIKKETKNNIDKLLNNIPVDDFPLLFDDAWFIRFEISCRKNQLITLLKNHNGFNFEEPKDLLEVIKEIKLTAFSDYFSFCTINLKDYMEQLKSIIRKNKPKIKVPKRLIVKLLNPAIPKVNIYYYMKKIARLKGLRYLYDNVKKYKNIKNYDQLRAKVQAKFGIDLSTDLTYLK